MKALRFFVLGNYFDSDFLSLKEQIQRLYPSKYSSMSYTIKISKNDKEAGKIIAKIKEIIGDSPFVSIYEDETGLSDDMVQELESRYQHVIKNPDEGKSWEEVKTNLLNR